MSESPASRAYQLLRNTYFLPLGFIWPLATGLRTIYSNLAEKEQRSKGPLGPKRKCRYRLDTDTSRILNLPDGRKLGYAEYGAPDGRPVFYMHGYPGCRLEGALHDEIGKKHNARIISVDRPGYGWSSPQRQRRVIDFAKDVECLADHLKLDSYLVTGTSGGGPYTLACAAGLPADRLKGVAVVVGAGTPDMSKRGMCLTSWMGWTYIQRYCSPIVRWWISGWIQNQLHLDDDYRLNKMIDDMRNAKMHPKDAEIWQQDPEFREDCLRLHLKATRQAYGQGLEGIVRDGNVMASDWGFRIEDIRRDLPVELWYGKQDIFVGNSIGEQTVARLGPKANLRLFDDGTHDSVQFEHQEKILTTLLEKW